jgi:hypothetical protein
MPANNKLKLPRFTVRSVAPSVSYLRNKAVLAKVPNVRPSSPAPWKLTKPAKAS